MLTLYYKPTCTFSQQVLGVAEELGLTFNLKDISHDPVLVAELVSRGGDEQTPYFVDTDKNTEMYESNDIINYLITNYSDGNRSNQFKGLRVHRSDEACETCQ